MLTTKVRREEASSNIMSLGKNLKRDNNPFLATERYVINLLQKHRILDKSIHPTWRANFLKEFIKCSNLNEKVSLEEKLERYDIWLDTSLSRLF